MLGFFLFHLDAINAVRQRKENEEEQEHEE